MSWIRNSDGKKDSMLTLGVISLAVILFKFVFSELTIGSVTFGQLDGSVIAAILAPTLGAYVCRRYTDSLNPKKEDNESSK